MKLTVTIMKSLFLKFKFVKVFWMIDPTEDSIRMRQRMARNPHGSKHLFASQLAQNAYQGSPNGGSYQESITPSQLVQIDLLDNSIDSLETADKKT